MGSVIGLASGLRDLRVDTAASIESVRAFLAAGDEARSVRIARRVQTLRALLPALVACLRDHGATRIWLFGSLVWGPIHERSDLDLAVEGLAPARFFEAYEAVWDIAGEPVDLVPIERAAETLRDRILRSGEELPT